MNHHIPTGAAIATIRGRGTAYAAIVACAAAFVSTAQAADVDLVTNITLSNPDTTAQTFVPVQFDVEFANRHNTATHATGSITFSEHLSAVSITSKPTNASTCPSAASFSAPPTGTTTGGETMTVPLPQLLPNQSCFYELNVTPTQAGKAYSLSTTMSTGAADRETNPVTNSSGNPFAVTRSILQLQVSKERVPAADPYATPTRFKVTYKNLSNADISLGATESQWTDWEGTLSPQIAPASSTLTNFHCSSDKQNQAICDAISYNQNVTSGTNVPLFASDFTTQVMKANETVTITYDRNYAPPTCGNAEISNTSWWEMADNTTPQWIHDGSSTPADNMSSVTFTLENTVSCTLIPLTWSSDKTLVGIKRGTAITQNPQILSDGDQALYDLTIDLSDPANNAIIHDASIPHSSKTVTFSIYDFVRLSNGTVPMPFPARSALVQMEWISCTEGNNSDCASRLQAPRLVQPYDSLFSLAANQWVNVEIGTKVTLRLALSFRLQPTPSCMQQTASLVNQVSFSVLKPADDGYVYTETVPSGRMHQTGPIGILPTTPYCVNLTVNQSVTPTDVSSDTTPVTFNVTFINNSAPHGPDTVDLATGTTTLGSSFKARSASCSASGDAQVPAGSLLGNISGPDNLFQIDIANMARGALVRCTITGTVQGANSFDSIATIALKHTSARIQGDPVSNVVDPFPADDKAYVNYRTPGAVPTPAAITGATPVPGATPWGLALLAVLIGGLAWRQRRQSTST